MRLQNLKKFYLYLLWTRKLPNVAERIEEHSWLLHCGPYAEAGDSQVEQSGITLTKTGSPYAIALGRILKSDGTPYRVYTPFFRA